MSPHQEKVFCCLAEEEALHAIFKWLVRDIMDGGVPTPVGMAADTTIR